MHKMASTDNRDNPVTGATPAPDDGSIHFIHVDFDKPDSKKANDDVVIEIDAVTETVEDTHTVDADSSPSDSTTKLLNNDADEILYIELDDRPDNITQPKADTNATTARRRKSKSVWWWAAAAVLVVAGSGTAYLMLTRQTETPPPPVDPYTIITADIEGSSAVSADPVTPIPGLPNDEALAKALVNY